MRRTLLALTLAVPAQEAEDRAAIEGVISGQLSDFLERDVAGAWTFASPMIQGMFGSLEIFGRMVKNGYPMVWDNRNARFLELREEAGALRQKVMVEDPEGRLWVLDYEMVELEDGWKINGVMVLPAPDLSA